MVRAQVTESELRGARQAEELRDQLGQQIYTLKEQLRVRPPAYMALHACMRVCGTSCILAFVRASVRTCRPRTASSAIE